MKNNLCKVVALVLFTMVLGGAALAQDYGYKIRADIPFSFYAGTQLMPAGTYTFAANVANHNVEIGQSRSGPSPFFRDRQTMAQTTGLRY